MGQSGTTGGVPPLLGAIYEQHWLHVRHLENERMNFASLYALLIAGGVALVFGQSVERAVQMWVLLFLMLVTLMVAAITWRLSKRLEQYRIHVDKTAELALVPKDYLVPRLCSNWDESYQTQKLLLLTYVLAFIGLIYLAVAVV